MRHAGDARNYTAENGKAVVRVLVGSARWVREWNALAEESCELLFGSCQLLVAPRVVFGESAAVC